MQYEIPNSISLVVGLNDTQLEFIRRVLIEAARLAGLPLIEQVDYASSVLRLPINVKEAEKLLDIRKQETSPNFRILWNGKDPSPIDKTLAIQDWEFNKVRGKKFSCALTQSEKDELTRRQIYYQLNGGVLGSMQEIPRTTDVIIVEINFVYEKSQFDQAKAQTAFQKQIAFAEKVYGVIEIKFYSTWAAGTGDWETRIIKEGRKSDQVNVFLSVRKQKDAVSAIGATVDTKTGEISTDDIFLTKGQFENGGGLVDNSLREAALAHELGHKFGVNYYDGVNILGFDKGNWNSDFEINGAINRLSRETVRKGYDWNKTKNNLIIATDMRDFWTKMSVYDKLRLGARRLSKA